MTDRPAQDALPGRSVTSMGDNNGLHQINASFIPEEDRILLRLNSRGGAEYRCWLTRRYLQLLWKVILQVAERLSSAALPDPYQADPSLRAEMARMSHDPLTGSLDTKTQFATGTRFPLGDAPLLLVRITHRPHRPGRQHLRLEPAKGEGIDIVVDERIAHTLLKILSDSANAADWGLDLRLSATGEPSAALPPERLH